MRSDSGSTTERSRCDTTRFLRGRKVLVFSDSADSGPASAESPDLLDTHALAIRPDDRLATPRSASRLA